jgi:oligopeptide/dipeptide ABC transporter ATP-binding protein
MKKVILKIDNVSKYFKVGNFRSSALLHASDEVSFEIRESEIVALVGESGSGKSTIARILAGIYQPSAGTITFEGQRIQEIEKRYIRGKMPLVFQDPFSSINPVFKVGHGILRTLKLHRKDLSKAERFQLAVDFLEKVGLTPGAEVLQRYPHELSGGQRQRLGFAQALASNPSLILADEPVSMLDVSIRIGLLNLMRDLRTNEKVSILYITHDLASARYIADRMIVLYAGKIVEEGLSEAVVANPRHPYTQLLMSTAPDPRLPYVELENTADLGEPPKVINPQPGCRFAPRCSMAIERCHTSDPELLNIESDRRVSCFVVQA